MLPYSAQVDNAARLHKENYPPILEVIEAWQGQKPGETASLLTKLKDPDEMESHLNARGSSLVAAIDYVIHNVPQKTQTDVRERKTSAESEPKKE